MTAWTQGGRAWARTLATSIVAAGMLHGCGGGGGGVDIGGGQGPDPVVVDVPIAYVKRPIPVNGQGAVVDSDVREMRTFNIGADLFVRDRATVTAPERNITTRVTQGTGLYDVRDLDVSYDGRRIIFAMRGPFVAGADEADQPTWNIWEYDLDGDDLHRVIPSDLVAEEGHDVAPHYLPDGRIVFSSTRQRQSKAVLLDEGKPQFDAQDEDRREPAFLLHVMNPDGSGIHQISFNQSHDLDPTVMADGRILFSRWDHAGSVNAIHLYTMNPDGTDLQLYYGARSHATGTNAAVVQFVAPHQLPDGRVQSLIRPVSTDRYGGDLVLIDGANYLENLQPNAANAGLLSGPAQLPATVNDVHTDGTVSPGGMFSAAWPLSDGTSRMFVSWSPCRLVGSGGQLAACTPAALAAPNPVAAPPLYGIWIYDMAARTQLPILTPAEGLMFTDVVAAQPRTAPPIIYDKDSTGELDDTLVAQGVGLIDIRSVYDLDGTASRDIAATADPATTTAAQRPARFLRIEKAVAIPDRDFLDFRQSAFGVSRGQGMREILGYVPVEPDGSVVAKVPANVALALSVLDANGRRIGARHQNWLQVRPGQVLKCNGCHDSASARSHGRSDSAASAWAGAAADGQPFPNTDPAFFADFGETMAEVKKRISCATDCALVTPGADVAYEDIWTNPATAGRPKDASFAFRYADLTTPAPESLDCGPPWSANCRIVINYETHLHPLWGKSRPVFAMDGVTEVDNHACTSCHSPVDGNGAPRVPAAQLDLSDGASDIDPDHFKSYRELLSGDNEQEIVGGVLQDRQVQVGVDLGTGLPLFAPVPVGASLSTAGANASPAFFNLFAPGGSHAGWLTPAELRLVSEWVDLGAQYFNDPFAAPLN